MNVLLVTSWDTACGIAEHSAMLVDAVTHADGDLNIAPCRELDPGLLPEVALRHVQILHLNYQAALHSRWTPDWIRSFRDLGYKVVVTYHDSGTPNSDHCKAICAAANEAVVHEPYDDLPADHTHYWRMGVPPTPATLAPFRRTADARPVLGTIGFPFPWKNYPALIRAATSAGWNVLIFAPGATHAQLTEWVEVSEHVFIRTEFVPRGEAITWLGGCDATAFCYVTHNTGQSGAILLGIAARKPVYALSTCRQFRALYLDPLGREAIHWIDTFEQLTTELKAQPLTDEIDTPTAALAEQESWGRLGEQYAALYRSLV